MRAFSRLFAELCSQYLCRVTSFSGESIGAKTANKEADLVRKSRPQWVCPVERITPSHRANLFVSAILPQPAESSSSIGPQIGILPGRAFLARRPHLACGQSLEPRASQGQLGMPPPCIASRPPCGLTNREPARLR